jgi:glyoxylase-like metal-dependent hydrolase (beta-lactamase superfamily II)
MSWSTTVVSPPGGDMADYFNSLRLLLDRTDDVFLPGHGPTLPQPRDLVREMLTHRMAREQTIAAKLAADGAANTFTLMDTIYSQLHPRLRRAAERNVLAHLMKLEAEGKVVRDGELWRAA